MTMNLSKQEPTTLIKDLQFSHWMRVVIALGTNQNSWTYLCQTTLINKCPSYL